MPKYEEKFFSYLQNKNLKMTQQRKLILDVFLGSENHIAAEDLYLKARDKDLSLGQATVYRTLKLLSDAGVAQEVSFGDGVIRYERKQADEHHDHLICSKCKKSIEVSDPRIEELQVELAGKHGFLLTEHRMVIYGICEECRSLQLSGGESDKMYECASL